MPRINSIETPPGELPSAQGGNNPPSGAAPEGAIGSDALPTGEPKNDEDSPPWHGSLNERPVELRERFVEALPIRELVDLIKRMNVEWLRLSGHQQTEELSLIEVALDQLATRVVVCEEIEEEEQQRLTSQSLAAGEEIDRLLREGGVPSAELLRRYGVPEEDIESEIEKMKGYAERANARRELNEFVRAGQMPSRELVIAAGEDPEYLLPQLEATFAGRKSEAEAAEKAEAARAEAAKAEAARVEAETAAAAAAVKQLVDDNSHGDLVKIAEVEGVAFKVSDSKGVLAQAIFEARKAKTQNA